MKKLIEFTSKNFEKQTISLSNNLAIIMGHANTGKTQILNALNYGFQGTKNKISIDNVKVELNEYNVIYVTDVLNLEEDLKLSKTSSIKRYLMTYLNNIILNSENYNNIEAKFNDFKSAFDQLVNANLFAEVHSSSLKLHSDILNVDLEKYVEKLLNIKVQSINNNEEIECSNYSKVELRKLWYQVLSNIKVIDPTSKNVILIDTVELFAGPLEWKWWANLINDLTNNGNICIITTMNPYFLNCLNWNLDNLNIIKANNEIIKFNNHKFLFDYICMYSFLENEQEQDLITFKDKIKQVILKEDYDNEFKFIKTNLIACLEIFLLQEHNWFNDQNTIKFNTLTILFAKNMLIDFTNIKLSSKYFKIFPYI